MEEVNEEDILEEQIEKMIDENNADELPAAEIQKEKPKEKEKNF